MYTFRQTYVGLKPGYEVFRINDGHRVAVFPYLDETTREIAIRMANKCRNDLNRSVKP